MANQRTRAEAKANLHGWGKARARVVRGISERREKCLNLTHILPDGEKDGMVKYLKRNPQGG